jgi:hypothetical protein
VGAVKVKKANVKAKWMRSEGEVNAK